MHSQACFLILSKELSHLPFLDIFSRGYSFKGFVVIRPWHVESEVVGRGGQHLGHKTDKLLVLTMGVVNHKSVVIKIVHPDIKKYFSFKRS